MARSILVKNATVFTMDSQKRVVQDGALYAEGDKIIKIGKTEEVVKAAESPEYVINGERKALLPGLVDTHTHLVEAIMRGLVPDNVNLASWLREGVWPLQTAVDADIMEASAQLCLLEMLKTGTTSFLEAQLHTRWGIDRAASALAKSGVRGIISKMIMDQPTYEGTKHPFPEEKDAAIKELRRLHREWNGKADGRIRIGFGINNPRVCSEQLAKEVAEVSKETGCFITMHLGETKADIVDLAKRNTTPGELVTKSGIAQRGAVFAHGVWLSDKDIALLAKAGASVAHCPSSNMKLASGIAPVPKMLKARLNVGLGCDGGPSNDCYDMFREMKTASLLHKVAALDPTIISSIEVLAMATINGAKALGVQDQLGSIEKGKKADFVLVDLKKPHFFPLQGVSSDLVYSAHGYDVSHVVVDGNVLVEDRQVKSMSEESVLNEVSRQAQRMLDRVHAAK
ncbi:MAG: amidohydrolase [Thaumarchaeota archaeon]|nr:amidohydrolase [Nitrososphaerota archaeon]